MVVMAFALPVAGADAPRDAFRLDPIEVTAEKVIADSQDTGISMFVIEASDLMSSGVTRLPDLALQTPGVAIGNNGNPSSPEIFIRGVGTTDISSASDLSAAIYLDGVYLSRPEAIVLDLYDIERIEVLRGPQGTLYGRNAIGGAINIVSKSPAAASTAVHRLTYGNYDLFRTSGAVNGSIIDDLLLGRGSYYFVDQDGYTRNIYDGEHRGDTDSFGGRGSFNLTLADNMDLLLNLDFSRDRPSSNVYKPIQSGDSIFGGGFPFAGVNATSLGHIEPGDNFVVNHDRKSRESRDIYGVSSEVNWAVEDVSIVSLTAFRSLDFETVNDVDGISIGLLDFYSDLEQHQISQEFRIAGPDSDRVRWLTGLYFFAEETDNDSTTDFPALSLVLGPGDYSATNFTESATRSYAAFGHCHVDLGAGFEGVFGLRYTYEQKSYEIRRITNDLGTYGIPQNRERKSWDAVTPKVGLNYRPGNDVIVYGLISRGFKSGGFNSLQQSDQAGFGPEYLTAYEIGMKSQWFDDRLRVNASTFFYDHDDLQVQTLVTTNGTPDTVTTNAAEAEGVGAEIEIQGVLPHGLEVTTGIALLDAEYKTFTNAAGIDVSGNTTKRSPELSTSFILDYTRNLHRLGTLLVRGEYYYQSKIYFTETNEGVLSQGGFHQVNARLALLSPEGRVQVALFGKNLTDEETINVAFDFRDLLGDVLRTFNPPRTYGVELEILY